MYIKIHRLRKDASDITGIMHQKWAIIEDVIIAAMMAQWAESKLLGHKTIFN